MDGVARGTIGDALASADRAVRVLLAHVGVFVFGGALSVAIAVPGIPHARVATVGAREADRASPDVPAIASSVSAGGEAVAVDGATAGVLAADTSAPGVELVPPPVAAPAGATGGELVTASWYGPGFYGNRLPCWQWLEARKLPIALDVATWGVAHRTLPCGTAVALSYRGRSVVVPVLDRGPYVAGRALDLTAAVKAALGCPDICTLLMQLGD